MSVEDQIAANTATLKDALKLFEDELAEKVASEKAAAATKMAKAVLAAIGENTPGIPVAFVSDSPATVKASSTGVLTATQAGYTMSGTYPDAITGWRGRTLEKDGDTTVVYTNIENSVATEISDIYDASSAPGEPAEYGVFATVDENTNTHNIPWSAAKRSDDKSATAGDGATATTTFAGTVRGLVGTFTCTGDCTPPVPNADTGAITSGEMWRFVPTNPNGTIDVADSAYVSFGWWLNAMGTEGDEYEFDAFASVEGMEPNTGTGAALEGSATYRGGAAGKYSILSTTDDSADGGHFTASATLAVSFDANTAVEGQQATETGVSISGTINNFVTGDTSRPNWKVTLSYDNDTNAEGVQLPEAVAPIMGLGATTRWTTGGAVPGTGTWNANFYGTEKETLHPTAVAGEFNAAIGAGEIGRISGAFGATK